MTGFIFIPIRNWIIIIFGLLISVVGSTQSLDSVLMNETTLSRPLVVHKNQLRINTGYDFQVHNNRFEGSTRIRLSDRGNAGVGHGFQLNLEYGIQENIQVGVNFNFLNQALRTGNVIVVDDPIYDVYYVEETRGWGDPLVSLTYRLPLPKAIDLLLSFDATIPLAKSGYRQPANQITRNDASETGTEYYTINLVDRVGQGRGVFSLGGSVILKYRFNDQVALTGGYAYLSPQGESTDKNWYYTLLDNERFIYESTSFRVQQPDYRKFFGMFEYQAFSSFNISTSLVGFSSRFGWTENLGIKEKVPQKELVILRVAYEIVATPKVWISQHVDLPVSGTNTLAPMVIQTRLRYNITW